MAMKKTLAAVLFLSLLAAGCGGANSSTEKATGGAPPGDSAAPQATAPQATVSERPKPICAYTGTDPDFGYMQVDLTFTNPLGDDLPNMYVTYALLDGAGGTRFFTGTAGDLDLEDIKFPKVNEQFRLSVNTSKKVPAGIETTTIGCSVLGIKEGIDIGGYERASNTDTCQVMGVDSRGRIQVKLVVTSPYKQTTKVQTWWALQAPGPVTFETETKVVDLVGAGESFQISPDYGPEKPEWVGATEITCAVLGFWDQGQ